MNPSIETSPTMPPTPVPEQNIVEVASDNKSLAEQVGLTDGQFDVLRGGEFLEKGWHVKSVGTDTDKDTGLQRQFVVIEKPQLDINGVPILDEQGQPVIESAKDIWTDKLMSWQENDQVEDEDTREAEQALEEIGGVAVDATAEVDEVDGLGQVNEAEQTTESPLALTEVENTVEIEGAKSGPASEELQKIQETFIESAKKFDSIHAQVESLPVTVGKLTEAFTQNQGQYLDQVGNALVNVKGLIEPLRNMAPLLRELGDDVYSNIDQRTRQALQTAVENAQQVLRGIGGLSRVVSEGKLLVDGNQRNLAAQITDAARQIEVTVEAFEGETKKSIDQDVFDGYEKVYKATKDDSVDEIRAIRNDRGNLEHFDHDLDQIGNMSRNIQEATSGLGNAASRDLDYGLTGTILNTHGLNSMGIDEAYSSMSSFVRVLEALASHSNGTKGNILAELQPAVSSQLSTALSIIDRMRKPTTEYADQNSSFSKLRNRTKDVAVQSDRLARYLAGIRREIENGARAA